jgi:type II secretory pathway pseudopilin PulG
MPQKMNMSNLYLSAAKTYDPSSRRRNLGFTLLELVVVLLFILIVAAIVVPGILQTIDNLQLRSSTGELAGMMQEARMLAAKKNTTYTIGYTTVRGARVAFIDLNNDGVWETGEPMVQFSGSVAVTSGAPTGSGGQPTAYVLAGDSGSGGPYTNGTTLGFSPRGFPCSYISTTTPPTCSTPAASYFVYYLSNSMLFGKTGWAAVVVTRGGRAKTVFWGGQSWN